MPTSDETSTPQSMFDLTLAWMDTLIVYRGRAKSKVRDVARRAMEMAEGHEVGVVGYVGLSLLHYAAACVVARKGAIAAKDFLQGAIGILQMQSDQLEDIGHANNVGERGARDR